MSGMRIGARLLAVAVISGVLPISPPLADAAVAPTRPAGTEIVASADGVSAVSGLALAAATRPAQVGARLIDAIGSEAKRLARNVAHAGQPAAVPAARRLLSPPQTAPALFPVANFLEKNVHFSPDGQWALVVAGNPATVWVSHSGAAWTSIGAPPVPATYVTSAGYGIDNSGMVLATSGQASGSNIETFRYQGTWQSLGFHSCSGYFGPSGGGVLLTEGTTWVHLQPDSPGCVWVSTNAGATWSFLRTLSPTFRVGQGAIELFGGFVHQVLSVGVKAETNWPTRTGGPLGSYWRLDVTTGTIDQRTEGQPPVIASSYTSQTSFIGRRNAAGTELVVATIAANGGVLASVSNDTGFTWTQVLFREPTPRRFGTPLPGIGSVADPMGFGVSSDGKLVVYSAQTVSGTTVVSRIVHSLSVSDPHDVWTAIDDLTLTSTGSALFFGDRAPGQNRSPVGMLLPSTGTDVLGLTGTFAPTPTPTLNPVDPKGLGNWFATDGTSMSGLVSTSPSGAYSILVTVKGPDANGRYTEHPLLANAFGTVYDLGAMPPAAGAGSTYRYAVDDSGVVYALTTAQSPVLGTVRTRLLRFDSEWKGPIGISLDAFGPMTIVPSALNPWGEPALIGTDGKLLVADQSGQSWFKSSMALAGPAPLRLFSPTSIMHVIGGSSTPTYARVLVNNNPAALPAGTDPFQLLTPTTPPVFAAGASPQAFQDAATPGSLFISSFEPSGFFSLYRSNDNGTNWVKPIDHQPTPGGDPQTAIPTGTGALRIFQGNTCSTGLFITSRQRPLDGTGSWSARATDYADIPGSQFLSTATAPQQLLATGSANTPLIRPGLCG